MPPRGVSGPSHAFRPKAARNGPFSRLSAGLVYLSAACQRATNRVSRVSVIFRPTGLTFDRRRCILLHHLWRFVLCARLQIHEREVQSWRTPLRRFGPCGSDSAKAVSTVLPSAFFRGGNLTFRFSGVDYMALFENATIPLGVKGYADGESPRRLFCVLGLDILSDT